MLLGVSLAVLGLQCVFMGILSQVFFDYAGTVTAKWFRRFPYTRTVVLAAVSFFVGLFLTGRLAATYVGNYFSFPDPQSIDNLGFTGLLLMIVGFMSFTFTLILHSTDAAVRRR
jgi:hypothetical protein